MNGVAAALKKAPRKFSRRILNELRNKVRQRFAGNPLTEKQQALSSPADIVKEVVRVEQALIVARKQKKVLESAPMPQGIIESGKYLTLRYSNKEQRRVLRQQIDLLKQKLK